MKKILFMRHSIPKKIELPTEKLPLSQEGLELIQKRKESLEPFQKVYCSAYQRAIDTAKVLSKEYRIEKGLHERLVGDAKEDFWLRQYEDPDFKNEGGESLNEVKKRMDETMKKILANMDDDETAVVVSHATAICSYLMNFCDILVVDPDSKTRKIIYQGEEVYCGRITPTEYFVLIYEQDKFKGIITPGNM